MTRWRVIQIISGGQTGVDQGGLLAGPQLGILTGGIAPQGWLTENGPQEALLRRFQLIECGEPGYPARTRANVLNADATLLIGPYQAGGSSLTARIAREARRPVFHVPYAGTGATPNEDNIAQFREWLERHDIRVLNVAGNRESQSPGIQDFTQSFLVQALGGTTPPVFRQ